MSHRTTEVGGKDLLKSDDVGIDSSKYCFQFAATRLADVSKTIQNIVGCHPDSYCLQGMQAPCQNDGNKECLDQAHKCLNKRQDTLLSPEVTLRPD